MEWRSLFGDVLDEEHAPVVVLGIDLGTTYSTVTRIEWSGTPDQLPRLDVVPIRQFDGASIAGRLTVLSTVAISADGRLKVGESARAERRGSEEALFPGHRYFENTKNDIGTSKRYANDTDALASPTEVASSVVRFLLDGVREQFPDDDKYDHIVVTVPASFQLTQRSETIRAVELAGLDIASGALLDEPVAALLTWRAGRSADDGDIERTIVVDFGGGTCDVALIAHERVENGVDVEVVGTSRYTRLGGSDIDRAIAVEHLVPLLAVENGVDPSTWTWQEKAGVILPRLAETAEELKLKMSQRMADRLRIGRGYDDVVERASRDIAIALGDKELVLPASRITLSATDFMAILAPFVNPDLLTHKFGEYYETASVFGPILDLMDRVGLDTGEIDRVLLTGGSSYLPPVREALAEFFGRDAEYVVEPEAQERQTEISQGAALHAFALAANGAPLVRMNSGEALEVNVTDADGKDEWDPLIPAGVSLPWHDVFPKVRPMRVSEGSKPIRFALRRAGLGVATTEVAPPKGVLSGDTFYLEYGLDGSGTLHTRLRFATDKNVIFTVERPGSFVVNPGLDRERILEVEGELAAAGLADDRKWSLRRELSDLYRKVGHHEHAEALAMWIKKHARTQQQHNIATSRVSLTRAARGDEDGAISSYRAGIDAGARHMQFDLAYFLCQRGRNVEALELAEQWLSESTDGEDYALRGYVLKALRRDADSKADFERARVEFGSPRIATSFTRSWMRYTAGQLGDKGWLADIRDADRDSSGSGSSSVLPMRGESAQ